MNPTHVKKALSLLGAQVRVCHSAIGLGPGDVNGLPARGLLFIQWTGPWDGGRIDEQYRHTHWIACRNDAEGDCWVYDINVGDWTARWFWEEEIVPVLTKAHSPRATGAYRIRSAYDVVAGG